MGERNAKDYDRLLDEDKILFTTRIPKRALPHLARLMGRHVLDRGGSPEDATRVFLTMVTAIDGKRTQELIDAISASVPSVVDQDAYLQSRIEENRQGLAKKKEEAMTPRKRLGLRE